MGKPRTEFFDGSPPLFGGKQLIGNTADNVINKSKIFSPKVGERFFNPDNNKDCCPLDDIQKECCNVST